MSVPIAAHGETIILQLQILEGEGAVFAASGRALKPVTVRVTDETGAPMAGAAVSFRLPEEGVTGVFQNGLKTDMALSGPDGRAVAPNIVWGPLAGPARLRVTAALDAARAGVLVPVFVAAAGNVVVAGASTAAAMEPRQGLDPAPTPKLKSRRRWLKWVVVAGGIGAGALAMFTMRHGRSGSSTTTTATGAAISIGQPSISVGGRTP